MEFLRKLILQTGNHLKGLTVSQRLAIGSCVGLIALALLWLAHWASSPVMVPLLDQPMTAQELTAIEQRLTALGVSHKSSGNMILVPSEDRIRAYAQLAQSQSLPRDTSIGFAELIRDSSPWSSVQEKDRHWTIALQNQLAQVLREFEGIEDAKVFLDKSVKRTLGQPPVVPTASVFLRPASGVELGRDRVTAVAMMISGAVGGLDPTQVKVADMVTGRSYSVPKAEDALAFADLDDRQKKEAHYANKIRELYANIPGLLVAVHARLDEQASQTVTVEYGKQVALRDRSDTSTQTRGQPAQEPGVNPNTSVAINPTGSSENMEKNTTETEYDAKVDRTVTRTDKPRNVIQKLYASINVPRSYLAAIFRNQNTGKEPTDTELETFSTPELVKMKGQVRRVLGLSKEEADEQIEVSWVHDETSVQQSRVSEAGPTGSLFAMMKMHGGEVGLGGLVLIALLMMLMMVRRAAEGPVLPGESPPLSLFSRERAVRQRKGASPEMDLTVMGDSIGEAELSDDLLVAKEIDEDTLQTKRIVDQVTEMIREDPKSSVSILKRWIDQDQQ